MPDEIVIVDEQGTEHHFPAGMDPKQAVQIVRNANLKAANERPLKEPTTKGAGFMKGLDDYATELGQGMFESAAHPKTAGDFLGLMLPTSMGTAGPNVLKGLKRVGESEPIGNKAVRGAARVGAEALDLTPNIVTSKTEEKVVKGLRDFSKKPEPRWLDRNLPNKSGLPTAENPVQTQRVPITGDGSSRPLISEEDRYMPNKGGVPDHGVPTGELPRPTEVDHHLPNESGYVPGSASRDTTLRVGGASPEVESAQDAVARMSGQPFKGDVLSTDHVPFGGVEVPHRVKKPRMASEVANPFGPDEAVHEELLKRLGGQGGEEAAVEGAEAVAKPMLKADEVAEAGRRLYGSRDAGRMLRPNDPKGGAEAIKRMAPGPSRIPLTAEARINGMPQEQTLEDALKQIILSRSNLPPE